MKKTLTKYDRYRLKDLEGYRKKKREWAKNPDQKEKRKLYMRIWRKNNPEKHREFSRNRYKKIGQTKEYKEHVRRRRIKWLYGLSYEDYELMLKKSEGKCLICKDVPKQRRLIHIDHDHSNGKVRGVLCSRCNGQLGWYEKYKEQIINYLKK